MLDFKEIKESDDYRKKIYESKYFNCEKHKLSDLLGVPIIIEDLSKGIKTEFSNNAFVVKFRFKKSNKEGKFISSAKSLLKCLNALPGFPVDNITIQKQQLENNKHIYILE